MVPLNVPLYASRDPADQCLYIFFNHRRDQVKILYHSPGGFCLRWRLERSSFVTIDVEGSLPYVMLTSTELLLLIDGISLSSTQVRKRFTKGA